MRHVTVHDLVILQNYFSLKREPSEQDKQRAAKIDKFLGVLVDDLAQLPSGKTSLDIPEIFEKLTGEKLENYR